MGNFSKAHIKASDKYNKKAYDTISVRLKKGSKNELTSMARASGSSLNSFVSGAIAEKISRLNAELALQNKERITEENRYAVACQVRTNLRFSKEIPYQRIIEIFKGLIPFYKYELYLISFFEEVRIPLLKKFMKEQNITREEILKVFAQLPNWRGEFTGFREALKYGEF